MKIPGNFDLRSLQVFVTTADQGGMTQSAKTLNMTQSAVSQIVAGLEDAVGVKLFDRSVRPIVLTAEGRILRERGRHILRETQDAFRETRTLERRRLASLTIAMTDSMSTVLGPHLYEQMNELSSYWRLWSGITLNRREAFLSRNVDLIIATSHVMEDVSGLNRYKVLQEPYVMIFPKQYKGPTELTHGVRDLPFLRYSRHSAMGLRIESQLNRLRLKFPDSAEFDRASAHTGAVSRGMGWGITTALCLLEKPGLLDDITILPIKRGSFNRHFDLLTHEDSLGGIPEEIARESNRILTKICLPQIYGKAPWLKSKIS